MIKVQGDDNLAVYSGKQIEGIYNPDGTVIQSMPGDKIPELAIGSTINERIVLGKQLYTQTCLACHQADGEGILTVFPPLAKSDYLNENVDRAIDIVLYGKTGSIIVNGEYYNNVMTALSLSNEEVANILTFIYNSWENNKTEVTPEMVAKVIRDHK